MRTAVLILLLSFIPLFAGDTLADTLCIAALKGDQDAAARLLERGADCNEINRTGSSPLSCARCAAMIRRPARPSVGRELAAYQYCGATSETTRPSNVSVVRPASLFSHPCAARTASAAATA